MSKFIHNVHIIMGGRQGHWLDLADSVSMDPLTLKLAHGRAFLETVFAPYGQTGYVELRCFPPRDKGTKTAPKKATNQDFFDMAEPGWIDALLDRAFQAEYDGLDVYVGALPRNRKRGQATDVDKAAWLFADCDEKDHTIGDVKARGGSSADLIVRSGAGWHLWWALPGVVAADAAYIAAQKAQQARLGSDRVHDLPRVLRLPGTSWFKDPGSPRCVLLLRPKPLH